MEEFKLFITEHRTALWVIFSLFVLVHISIGAYRVKTEKVDGTWGFWKKMLLLDFWGFMFVIALEIGASAL